MGKNVLETFDELMKDPEFRAEWEALEPERRRIQAELDARRTKTRPAQDRPATRTRERRPV